MDLHVSRSTHCRFIGILANRSVLARSHSVDLWIPSCDDFQPCLLDFHRVSVAHWFSSPWMPCEPYGALFTHIICEHVGYQKGKTVTSQPNKNTVHNAGWRSQFRIRGSRNQSGACEFQR